MKRAIVYLCSLPWDLAVAWPAVFLIWAFWGTKLRWDHGGLLCELKPGSFPLGGPVGSDGLLVNHGGWWPKGWYLYNRAAALAGKEPPRPWGGTCLGHAIFTSPGGLGEKGVLNALLAHETHHMLQAETANVQATLISTATLLEGAATTSALVWTLGGYFATAVAGWLVSWLNGDGRGFYRGSAHEVGAYAVGESWERKHGSKR